MKSLFLLLLTSALTLAADLTVTDLRAEHELDPQGIVAKPRLSWNLESSSRGKRQAGFHLLASSSLEKLKAGEGDLWDLNSAKSSQRYLLAWQGKALKSGQEVFWKVQVVDEKKGLSPWSASAKFTVGTERKLGKAVRTSGFESSNPVLNEIYQRNVATLGKRLEGYLAGDEKSLGDGHAVWRSAREFLYHYDSTPALLDWIGKVHGAQNELGYFPGGPGQPFGPVISDAGIAVPHAVWWMSGDDAMVKNSWERMENYMIRRELADPTIKGHSWGAPLEHTGKTPAEFVDLCYFGLTSRLMSELARPAEKPNNSIRYKDYSARVRKSFARQYLGEDNLLNVPTQDAQVLGIRSAVMTAEDRQSVIDHFVKTAKPLGDLSALAAKPLLPVLTLTGNQSLLFDLITDPKGPWADPKNKAFEASGTTEWLFGNVLGIDNSIPGFRQIRLTPGILPSKRLAWAKGHYDSPAGRISVHWEKLKEGGLSYKCTIPTGSIAIIVLPISAEQNITESGTTVKDAFGTEVMRDDEKAGTIQVIAQSGSYHFTIQ
ncbi:MAG: alpha-L-rhamnosidase C-terminal domain-containing protein [Akkermansiaceae bacterium]